tara:strand:- start:196 stop:1230 length:1035 start_codon:yes stop_codon:yes gene_type:complete
MEIDKFDVINSFKLAKLGNNGFYTSKTLECPSCGKKEEKFGIKFIGKGGLVNCWVCGYKSSIFKFLKQVGKSNLIEFEHKQNYGESISFIKLLENDNYNNTTKVFVELPEIKPPRKYNRVTKSEYLQSRGITPKQLEDFLVGTVKSILYPELKDYLIFQIFQNNRLVALLARTPFDKGWHKKNLEDSKVGKCKMKPRYWNTKGVEFQEILGGLDDITDSVHTVIVVEGLFDKLNIDNILIEDDGIISVFTFGHSFSDRQIELIKSKNNIKTVILMYDNDSLMQMKKISMVLINEFDNVFILPILEKGLDPGDITAKQFEKLISTKLFNPVDYYSSFIDIKLWQN